MQIYEFFKVFFYFLSWFAKIGLLFNVANKSINVTFYYYFLYEKNFRKTIYTPLEIEGQIFPYECFILNYFGRPWRISNLNNLLVIFFSQHNNKINWMWKKFKSVCKMLSTVQSESFIWFEKYLFFKLYT